MKPEYDVFSPGEHNGTFRGNNLAFVAAAEALQYWESDQFQQSVAARANKIKQALQKMAASSPDTIAEVRGKGLIQGLVFRHAESASALSKEAFKRGLIMETSGPHDEVAKVMPPLTIEMTVLEKGLHILEASLREVIKMEKQSDKASMLAEQMKANA